MWYRVLIPSSVIIIPILVMTTKCQAPKNESDVIVTYSNHAEADNIQLQNIPEVTKTVVTITESAQSTETRYPMRYEYEYAETTTQKRMPVTKESSDVEEPIQDDVVFLPNDRELERNEDYLQNEAMNFNHIMGGYKNMGDVLGKLPTTTTAHQDIIFVAGKNNENDENSEKNRPNQKGTYVDAPYGQIETEKPKPAQKLDCNHLDCDNKVMSVCGGKIENREWRYRLFLNECYFRKVNCNFRNSASRFKQVSMEFCKNVGVHHQPETRRVSNPLEKFDIKPVQVDNTRRSISSRRAMSVSVDGQQCSHVCPTSCPEDYEPECAVSSAGDYQVFLNHCKLDLHSCNYSVLWRRRPLSECVGGKKADMRQNRRFIDWMQRVGIVDNKGRLSFS